MRRPIQRCFPLFILPTFLCFIIGFIWPFLQGIYLSFCNFNTPRDATWVGIQNYVKGFKDPGFINAFKNTAAFAIVSIIIINVLAFTFAYALTQKIKGSNLFRTVFFMPNLIGGVVLGYVWQLIFDAILRRYNTYLTSNATYGFWGLVILVAWQQIGYMMIIYIAGLQAVPEDMMEAARIDGANRWQTLIHVTIPNVMPSITICTFLTLTNSFKLFDQNMALTGGAPEMMIAGGKVKMTELLALNIFSTYNINKNWHGVAQAKAVVFFILVAVLAIAQQAATRSKEVQQ
ncbi:sugar ABC transporter permease [Oscillibacter valericigenes]|uniref:carbohydrate ABC transporter permease n=1 Tax=Oscillibacter valericigenes TaxID=351091 RepID=UPI001F1824D3|nr:sugar ABC transporter permease [Oscillibacter valericigenes]MCF2665293.1 sugar ABC transporter permease [Oscillibacter valericigenes]